MLIDWFTVGAQALNFVVLVWLMKRFLYQPVLDAIAAREKRIADQIADAGTKQAQALAERQAFEAKIEAFDGQKAALLAAASEDAKKEGLRLLDEARRAADELGARRRAVLASEALQLNQAIGLRASAEVFAVARKTLADLATVSLEERIGEVFTRRLRELPPPAKATLAAALHATDVPARVRSAFELPPGQQAAIQNAINETFSADVPLRFETAPEAISGIELTVGGQKLSWSIADYLQSLEGSVAALLAAAAKAPVPAAAVPTHPLIAAQSAPAEAARVPASA